MILPSGRELTESAAAALSAGSRFRQALASVDRRKANVTLWVYPDSFATYRTVRRYLYDNHWRVATRPLPFGMPIAGWPGGTKSAAQ
ncbi:MAG: hypothetical protein IIA67_08925 [Planctomycetes bacterium]|nr:hypothetical protein [Planctomycetota bacterium]